MTLTHSKIICSKLEILDLQGSDFQKLVMILNSVSLVAGGREGAFRVKVFLYANTAETAETAWVCSVDQPGC